MVINILKVEIEAIKRIEIPGILSYSDADAEHLTRKGFDKLRTKLYGEALSKVSQFTKEIDFIERNCSTSGSKSPG